MPKEVDHDERRDEILTALAGLLADGGLRGLTIRSLAARLGGSVSMVTHYFPTRHSLLVNIGPWILKKWQEEIESLTQSSDDPHVQLRAVLMWLLPLTPESLTEEKAGLALLAGAESDLAAVQGLSQELSVWTRQLVRSRLEGLVDPGHLQRVGDLLYAVTQGVAVCACEDSGAWPAERQLAVLDDLLDSLGLLQAGAGAPGRLKDMKIDVRDGDRNVKEGA